MSTLIFAIEGWTPAEAVSVSRARPISPLPLLGSVSGKDFLGRPDFFLAFFSLAEEGDLATFASLFTQQAVRSTCHRRSTGRAWCSTQGRGCDKEAGTDFDGLDALLASLADDALLFDSFPFPSPLFSPARCPASVLAMRRDSLAETVWVARRLRGVQF